MTIRKPTARDVMLVVGISILTLASSGPAARADQPFLLPNTLVISSSTYDSNQGAVASLLIGSTLADSETSTSTAIANNDYVNVWFNSTPDGNFGVTSPINLLDVNPYSGNTFRVTHVPTDQVVTSFSSKSEGALHLTQDRQGNHLVFMGYASPNVGALDVSNSDAVPGQDPTNPVSFAFGADYAFHRTVVSMNDFGHFAYTPTIAYGGDNGRAALLGSNGLYYTVGNSNNGDADTFGAANGTNPDVTETTGLEVINPINAWTADVVIPGNNSAEVDPLIQYPLGKNGKLDKPGKDNNYRGVTEFGGALYFTKGSGSNGMDTVYTVNSLPTVANAAATAISVVPGFPTDSARDTGGDFAPFAIFFANATTMYVSDEGTNDATDATQHAGLEKWSLINSTWQLDYVLQQGLIGTVDSNLYGYDGQYPDVTTIGLRNLTGVVNSDGTVTLWATTATSSTSGDSGSDPNKVVRITDQLAATTVTTAVSAETFKTIAGPTYGTVYRGVAFVCGRNDNGICTRGYDDHHGHDRRGYGYGDGHDHGHGHY
jgi:hypothetical protein